MAFNRHSVIDSSRKHFLSVRVVLAVALELPLWIRSVVSCVCPFKISEHFLTVGPACSENLVPHTVPQCKAYSVYGPFGDCQ